MKSKSLKTLFFVLFAQLLIPDLYANGIDGLYQTLNPERGRNGQPTQKIQMQLTEQNGQSVNDWRINHHVLTGIVTG